MVQADGVIHKVYEPYIRARLQADGVRRRLAEVRRDSGLAADALVSLSLSGLCVCV